MNGAMMEFVDASTGANIQPQKARQHKMFEMFGGFELWRE